MLHLQQISLLVSAAAAFVWGVGVLLSLRYRRPSLEPGEGWPQGEEHLVSVVVPIRNEGELVDRCLASLTAQSHRRLEVVVIDDNSSDDSLQRANAWSQRDKRVKVVEAGHLPGKWVGKSWACHVGSQVAAGDWLLFTDGDAEFSEHAVTTALRYAEEERIDALSLMPAIECKGFWTPLVSPIMAAIIRLLFPMKSVNRPGGKAAYFYGSFILIRRGAYRALGGHASVKDRLVEDRALGERAKAAGLRIRVMVGRSLFRARLATSFGEVWNTVQRVTSSSLAGRRLLAVAFSITLSIVFGLPWASLILSLAAGFSGLALLASALSLGMMAATLSVDTVKDLGLTPIHSLTAPLGALVISGAVLAMTGKEAADLGLQWKGRVYRRS